MVLIRYSSYIDYTFLITFENKMKGKKLLVAILIILTCLIIAVFNTLWLKAEYVGGWRHYIGIGAWLIAAMECIVLVKSWLPKRSEL